MTCFFVEGHLEQAFISNICKGQPVRRIELNGSAVSIEQIVRRICTIYRTMRTPAGPIVVIFDRERRAESSAEIAAETVERLSLENIEAIVGIPDRCIETWMLYDKGVLPSEEEEPEGKMGAAAVKAALGVYSKAVDGPVLLKSCRAKELNRSASFRALSGSLDWMNCWWLNR